MTCWVTMSASHADMDQNPDFMYDRSLESEVRKTNWVPTRDLALGLGEFLPSIKIGGRRKIHSVQRCSSGGPFDAIIRCRNTQRQANKGAKRAMREGNSV